MIERGGKGMHIEEAMRRARKHAKSLRIVAEGQASEYMAEEFRTKAEALETICGEVLRLRKELAEHKVRRVRQVFEHQ